jgi:hypothetical protein
VYKKIAKFCDPCVAIKGALTANARIWAEEFLFAPVRLPADQRKRRVNTRVARAPNAGMNEVQRLV